MQKPQLAVIDGDGPAEDPFAELIDEMVERGVLTFDGGDAGDVPQQLPIRHRHQLQNPDFWFFAAGTVFIFLPFTSFIPFNAFEPLLAAGLFFNACGLIANLTRPLIGVMTLEERKHTTINIRLPSWGGWRMGWVPPRAPLVETIKW